MKAARIARVGLASTALAALALFGAVRALSPTNLALRKPVASSSRAYDTTPEAAVDGRKFGRLGFHSSMEDSPWISIDLGRRYQIERIAVFGRDDCCFDQSIPLALQVSDDGATYRDIDERKDWFTAYEPWIVKPREAVARFVRLQTRAHAVLVLSEVEINGHPAHGPR